MANIAENKFLLSFGEKCTEKDKEFVRNKIKEVFDDILEGEIFYDECDVIEGFFDSSWAFPEEIWEEILKDKPIYFRCLTEEYGQGLVSMNIHYEDGLWREPQYFDL